MEEESETTEIDPLIAVFLSSTTFQRALSDPAAGQLLETLMESPESVSDCNFSALSSPV